MTVRVSLMAWDLGHVPPGCTWGGVDEAGRGAWAGPVVAACALLDHATCERWGHVLASVRDSKRLTPPKREGLAAELKAILPGWGIAEVDNLAIDRDNILEATLDAMRQAVARTPERPRLLFVDGDRAPQSGLPERLLVEGDSTSCAVACASILAKTHRDRLMVEQEGIHPGYGFGRHKGYGTAEHRRALTELGTCGIHRLSYAPVAALQQPCTETFDAVKEALQRCSTVEGLQQWIARVLRPSYGKLDRAWVEDLREDYARRLVHLIQGQP